MLFVPNIICAVVFLGEMFRRKISHFSSIVSLKNHKPAGDMIKSREEVTAMIRAAKIQKGLTWKYVAEKVGKSKEWTTAACLGQMQMSKEQATIVSQLFGLPSEALAWLQIVPYKGQPGIPSDPATYRLYEVSILFCRHTKIMHTCCHSEKGFRDSEQCYGPHVASKNCIRQTKMLTYFA